MDRVRKKRGKTRVMPRGTASTLGGGWLGDRAGSMTAVVASLGILFRSGLRAKPLSSNAKRGSRDDGAEGVTEGLRNHAVAVKRILL